MPHSRHCQEHQFSSLSSKQNVIICSIPLYVMKKKIRGVIVYYEGRSINKFTKWHQSINF